MKRILLSGLLGCMLVSQSAFASNQAYLNMHKISLFSIIEDGCKLFGGAFLGMAAVAVAAGENLEKKDNALIAGAVVTGIGLYCASQAEKKEAKKTPYFPLGIAAGALLTIHCALFPQDCNTTCA